MKVVRILRRSEADFDILDEATEELMEEDGITPEEAGFLMGWEDAA